MARACDQMSASVCGVSTGARQSVECHSVGVFARSLSALYRLVLGNPEYLGANLGANLSPLPDEALQPIKGATAKRQSTATPSHRLSGGNKGNGVGSHYVNQAHPLAFRLGTFMAGPELSGCCQADLPPIPPVSWQHLELGLSCANRGGPSSFWSCYNC